MTNQICMFNIDYVKVMHTIIMTLNRVMKLLSMVNNIMVDNP